MAPPAPAKALRPNSAGRFLSSLHPVSIHETHFPDFELLCIARYVRCRKQTVGDVVIISEWLTVASHLIRDHKQQNNLVTGYYSFEPIMVPVCTLSAADRCWKWRNADQSGCFCCRMSAVQRKDFYNLKSRELEFSMIKLGQRTEQCSIWLQISTI